MSDGTKIELTDAEERILAFHGWCATGRHDLLLRAVGLGDDDWKVAEDRLLEVGFIAPTQAVSRQ